MIRSRDSLSGRSAGADRELSAPLRLEVNATKPGAVLLVVGGCIAQEVGAALAARLFGRVGAVGVVAMRLVFAAALLMVVSRPSLRGLRRPDWALVMAFGVVLASMNTLFYQAIARIPLGAAVTVEVLGPLTLSVITSGRALSWLWAVLAFGGVTLLSLGDLHGLDGAGIAFALGAAAMWAAYILLSARTGSRFRQTDGLALAMTVAALVAAPIGVIRAGTALFQPSTLALGAAVAVLSSALPYTFELAALRRLLPATFGILMAVAPAVAAVVGLAVLGQTITLVGAVAILMVVVAGAGAAWGDPG